VVVRLILCVAAVAAGATSLSMAQEHPELSFAGTSSGDAVAFLAAGGALLAGALVLSARGRRSSIATLLIAASVAWFVAEWDHPGVGSSLIFTVGLLAYATCPALVVWGMLAYPSGRLATWEARTALVAVIASGLLLLGVLPALFFDPQAQGCGQCPANLVVVTDDAGLVETFNRSGVRLGLVSSLGAIAAASWALARSSPARRRAVAPVLVTGGVYLGLVAWSFAASLDRGFVGTGELEHLLWLGEAVALVAFALATVVGRLRARRTRSSVAGLVVALGESARSGGLRDALARILGDNDLALAYPIGDGRYADVNGSDVDLTRVGDRSATPLVRDGRPVAMLVHRRGLLDNAELVDDVASAARLALENERLQAQVRAQEADLRASRVRIVEAGDHERRRLERDLHDGAQQRLVGLLLGLRLLRTRLGSGVDDLLLTRLDEATAELQRATDDLREVARGIHPAMLSDEGLAAALESLAESSPVPLRIDRSPDERFPPAVENAAYRVAAEAAKTGATCVSAVHRDGALVIDIDAEGEPNDLVELEDRVGALDGRILVEGSAGGAVRLHAEIPCD
jgi:signal transduction histidine kinase